MLYFVSRPIFECYICHIARAKGSALSVIENVQLEEIHRSETIRNSVLKSSQVTHIDIVSVLGNIFLLFWA